MSENVSIRKDPSQRGAGLGVTRETTCSKIGLETLHHAAFRLAADHWRCGESDPGGDQELYNVYVPVRFVRACNLSGGTSPLVYCVSVSRMHTRP